VTQSISGARSINPGNGSNFTENYTANYQFLWNFMKRSALNLNFGFNRFAQSGTGFAYVLYDPASPPPNYLYISDNGIAVVPLSSAQVGQQYLASVGTTYAITKNLTAGLTYTFIANDLNQTFSILSGTGTTAFGGYQTHNVVLSLGYQF
jgi:opacity protein-like surface antigen